MTQLTGVCMGIPVYNGQICMETAESLIALTKYFTEHRIPHGVLSIGAADLEAIRNIMLTVWYSQYKHISHMLFIDTDMEFQPTLINNMLAFDKPIIGCYYAKRQFPIVAVGQSLHEEDLSEVQDGFLKVKAVGTGIMLIRRDAITTMIEKFPDLVDTREQAVACHHYGSLITPDTKHIIRAFDRITLDDGFKLSEDISFCHRWRACGGDIWAEVSHRIGHVGRMNYECRYMDYLEDKARNKQAAA